MQLLKTLTSPRLKNNKAAGLTSPRLKNNKAAGLDEIPAELSKHGKERVAQELTHLFNRLWHAEDVPEE